MSKSKRLFSPLRFPGAKGRILNRILPYLECEHQEYREPFLGGGSVFLNKGSTVQNWINDGDTEISNFWKVVQKYPMELCEMIDKYYPDVELWNYFKSINNHSDQILRAFRLLFLNRTNYSGIYNANPIGGINQTSQYKIDCRWNPTDLKSRIILCSNRLQNTRITTYNYSRLIREEGDEVLIFLDPPYYKKGKMLYRVYFSRRQHVNLSKLLQETKHNFLLTIDDCEEIRQIYSWANTIIPETWKYTINTVNVGKELFITNIKTKEQ